MAASLCGQVDALPPDDDLAAQVATLIAQLNATSKQQRDQAEARLLELGPVILPLLPEHEAQLPAETTLRLQRVRETLERQQAEQSIEASRVTLSGSELSLEAVTAALREQTGNTVVDFRQQFGQQSPPLKLSLELDDEPFWPALDQVLDQAGMTIYPYTAQPGLALVVRSPAQRLRYDAACYAGAFRIAATRVQAMRDLQDGGNDRLQLQMEVCWEPRLSPIVLLHPTESVSATLDDGSRLQPSMPDRTLELNVTAGMDQVELPVDFALPSRDSDALVTLKGRLEALLPARDEVFRFTDLENARRVQQRRAGVTVTLESVRRNNFVWEVRLLVTYDQASGALESHRGWIFDNEVFLLTPDGERLEKAGVETTRQTANEVGVAYLFTPEEGLDGHTLIYKTPGAVIRSSIDYELNDIPLP